MCRFVDSSVYGKSLGPWRETHERSARCCMWELEERASRALLQAEAKALKTWGELPAVFCRQCQGSGSTWILEWSKQAGAHDWTSEARRRPCPSCGGKGKS
jgi:hypothetical protein